MLWMKLPALNSTQNSYQIHHIRATGLPAPPEKYTNAQHPWLGKHPPDVNLTCMETVPEKINETSKQ